MEEGPPPIFRAEALAALERGAADGEVLRVSPIWLRLSYWVLVLAAVAALAFVALGRIGDYASGPAVIVAPAHDEVRADQAGELVGVDVELGQRVAAGQRVATLRAKGVELAMYAPRTGVVSRLDARPGQLLHPGDGVADLIADDAPRSVTAFLPAEYQGLVRAGMPLRFRPRGGGDGSVTLAVTAVSAELADTATAARYLEGAAPSSPLLEVRAELPRDAGWQPGTPGLADVRVRSQRLLAVILPSLDAAMDRR